MKAEQNFKKYSGRHLCLKSEKIILLSLKSLAKKDSKQATISLLN